MLTIRKFEQQGLNPRLVLPITLLIVVAIIVWLLMATGKSVEPQATKARALPIDAFATAEQNLQLKVNSQGTIEPRTQSDLVAEVSGRVSWVSSKLVSGGQITQHDELLRIDAADYETELARAKAALARARAEETRATSDYQRVTQLHTRKLASKSELDEANRSFEVAKANLAEAEANVAKAQRDIRRTNVKAPYDGLVRSKSIDVGQYVSKGTAIAKVYATDYLEVRLPITNSELAFVDQRLLQAGAEADKPSVLLSANYAGVNTHWRGYIDRLEATIDTSSRMVFAVARLQSHENQPPPVGLFVRAQISGITTGKVTTIPRAALRDDNTVLVVGANNILQSRKISLLRVEGERLIVNKGLQDGDLVNTSLSPSLAAGTLVAPQVANQAISLQLDTPTEPLSAAAEAESGSLE
ncbi:MAG: efflux RND transporter periplasmic adaptor subunit [Pseudomonadales bacterium]